MKFHRPCTLVLLLAICWTIAAHAQLDPRERYGTYLGGSQAECKLNGGSGGCSGTDVKSPSSNVVSASFVDASGNVYVAGVTNAIDFPTTIGAYRRTVYFSTDTFGGFFSDDSFVAKFDATGHLIWSTYLNVPTNFNTSYGIRGISLDSSGNVVVVGSIETGDSSRQDFHNLFIAKLNSTGSALPYFQQVFPNSGFDCQDGGVVATAVAFDSAGKIYIGSDDAGLGTCVPATTGNNQTGTGFVVKVDTTLPPSSFIVYRARIDGANPLGLAVDSSGNAYVTGTGAYVTKLNQSGTFVFSLPIGSGTAVGAALITTTGGDIIFTGTAPSYSFPETASFGSDFSGNETFITRISTTGAVVYVYSAVIHDSNMTPTALARDSANEAFVTGRLNASSFRVNPYSNAPLTGAFLVRANSTGTSLWLDSAFGGHSGLTISVDKAWNAFVGGFLNSGEFFPITSNAFQSSFKGAKQQGFLAKLIIEADLKMLIQGASPNPVAHGANLTYTLAVFNNGPDASDGDTVTDVLPSGTTFVSFSTTTGTCTHPAVGSGGTFKCTRSSLLNKGSFWGPVKLTVHVNAVAGTTLKNTASVAAKTQDVVPSNNSATVYVKVQ